METTETATFLAIALGGVFERRSLAIHGTTTYQKAIAFDAASVCVQTLQWANLGKSHLAGN